VQQSGFGIIARPAGLAYLGVLLAQSPRARMADQQTENAGNSAEASLDPGGQAAPNAKAVYLESLQLIERLHRRFLDVVKVELDRVGVEDINNVQAVILYNIADSEITVGELTSRGYYQGSNVTYNLKKLVENGFLEQVRSPYDRRSVRVHLTKKGLDLFGRIDDLYQYQVTELTRGGLDAANLAELKRALLALERFWSDQVRFPSR